MTTSCLTAIALSTFQCPNDRGQAFLWDAEEKGLGVRVTPRGQRAFVYQRRMHGKTVRITIGRANEISIADARAKVRELRIRFDREVDLSQLQSGEITKQDDALSLSCQSQATVGRLWTLYLEHGKPKDRFRRRGKGFSPGYADALKWMAASGGVATKRGSGQKMPGPLHSLMSLRIEDLDEVRLRAWHMEQGSRSRSQATRALMMLRGFLRWCAVKPELHEAAAKAMKAAKALALSTASPASSRLASAIPASDLGKWWAAVLKLPNKKVSVFLRALVMTGLHSQAMLHLRWQDMHLYWGKRAQFSCHLYDRKHVPLTDEFVRLIQSLPQDSEFVFSGNEESGRVLSPHHSFKKTLQAAGLPPMPLSALRRTFIALSEMAAFPTQAIVQYTQEIPLGYYKKNPHIRHTVLLAHMRNLEVSLKQIFGVKSLV